MRVLGALVIAIVAFIVTLGAGNADTRVAGALLAAVGAGATTLNVLRTRSGGRFAARDGLGAMALTLLVASAFGASLGGAAWRAAAAAAEQQRLAEKQLFESRLAGAPAIREMLNAGEEHLAGGRLEECQAVIRQAVERLRPLQGHEEEALVVRELETQLEQLQKKHADALERRAIETSKTALDQTGPAAIPAMLEARKGLLAVAHPSDSAEAALQTLETRLTNEASKLSAFGADVSVLEAKLMRAPPQRTSQGLTFQLGTQARGMALVEKERCSSLYLVARPAAAGLSPAEVDAFMHLVSPVPWSDSLRQPPKGSGIRSEVRQHAGLKIHQGWADEKLTEIWVGDFAP